MGEKPRVMKLLRQYIRKVITEVASLPKEYFSEIDSAVSKSKFWTEENAQEDIDYYKTEAGGVMGTPAAEALSAALQSAMKKVNLDIDILVRSHDTDDAERMTLHSNHPAWPNRWLIDAKWYVSKQNVGRNTIDIEMMTSEPEEEIDNALDSAALVRHITQTVRHEIVHYMQMKKQAKSKGLDDLGTFEQMLKDPSQVPPEDLQGKEWQEKYLRSHIEIDAHAHDAAEEMLAVYSDEEINNILRGRIDLSDPKLPNGVKHYVEALGLKDKSTQKFMSKLYTQIEAMRAM